MKKQMQIYVMENKVCFGALSHGYKLPTIFTTKREIISAMKKFRKENPTTIVWVSEE